MNAYFFHFYFISFKFNVGDEQQHCFMKNLKNINHGKNTFWLYRDDMSET